MNIVDIGRTRAKSTTALALASPSTTAFIVEHPSQYYDALDKAAAGNGCYANEWPYSRSPLYRGVDSSSNGADEYRLQQVRLSFGSSRRALKNFNFSSNFAAATTKLKNDNAYYESFSFDDDALCSSPEREPFINRHLHHNQLISSSTEIYSSQVAMQQRRLVVPDVKVRSHSTPSSPKLLVHSSESAKDCINNNNIAVPTIPIRKYSYDNRINRSNESFDHQQLGRNLSLNTVNRRRLPPTPPENRSKTETTLQTFRWSLPKMPPETERKKSAPPMLPESLSSTSSSKTSDDGIVIRTGTGRKLPLVPDFSHEIRNEAYHKQWQQDEFILNSRPCKTPPLTNSVKTSCYAYPPDLHTNRVSSPHSRKYCQRRTSEQSIDQYVGIPCTCSTPPPCTPIAEHLESKSSSDTEDHCLDSSLDKRGSIADSLLLDDFYEGEPDEKSYGLGRLLFSVLYFPIRKRLRISIIKAESLAGRLKPDLELNTFLKICLMPGKIQKQRSSRVVKGDRNAIFNEEYFFDNVDAEDIKTKTVLIRICHRMPKQFLKDVVVGELDLSLISLSTISAKREIKLCRELRPKVVKVKKF